MTDPVGLGYSYPPPDCAGVLDGHFVSVVEHTDSETSNLVHSDHPGSSHVCLHEHTIVTVPYHSTTILSDIANIYYSCYICMHFIFNFEGFISHSNSIYL